jgi:hypothetical protein
MVAVVDVVDIDRDRRRKTEAIGEFNPDSGHDDKQGNVA